MTLQVHRLDGCTALPLGSYLKCLGILRLLSEQKDPEARGFFRGDTFHLATQLNLEEVVAYFLNEYQPSPLIAPWNGGSGFYPKDNSDGIDGLRSSSAPRFRSYQRAIELGATAVADRHERPKEDEKSRLVQRLRLHADRGLLDWIDAALVIGRQGELRYPALLGTGGNDGRLDFTNNFMQRLVELLDPVTGQPRAHAGNLLRSALTDRATSGLQKAPVGQFNPGAAGGANSTSAGFGGDPRINPWDFVLMLEGSLVFKVTAVRKLDGNELPQAAAPFAVSPQAAGYGSAADESARGEQWLPLWSRPATYGEISGLFAEGRLQLRNERARRALDASRAIARLGTARGIDAFERVGLIERNGQSNLAVPLGRWAVSMRPETRLVDEIADWVAGLRKAAGKKGAPQALGRAARRLEDAMLELCKHGGRRRAAHLLVAMGHAEALILSRPRLCQEHRYELKPIPYLSQEWLLQANDQSTEFHLAAAIGSQVSPAHLNGTLGSFRSHLLPLDPNPFEPKLRFVGDSLAKDPRVTWHGHDLISDMASVALRRLIDAEQVGAHTFPLEGRWHASLATLDDFVFGRIDDRRVADLVRPLAALSWGGRELSNEVRVAMQDRRRIATTPLMGVFRLLYSPYSRAEQNGQPRLDSTPLRQLLSGRLSQASELAARRLAHAGVRIRSTRLLGGPTLARRIAASIAVPIAENDMRRLQRELARDPYREATSSFNLHPQTRRLHE